MNKLKLLALGLVVAGGLSAQSVKCDGITKSNNSCKNNTVDTSGLCYLHNPNYVKKVDSTISVICSGITKSNNPCKNKTKDSSGHCHHHRK